MTINENDVLINGVRYIPADPQPDEIRFYYMHDNHTFSRLAGNSIDTILQHAETLAFESPFGILCPPTLLFNGKEVRRLKKVAHAPCCGDYRKWRDGRQEWRNECEGDSDVIRLVSSNNKG